MVPDELPRDLPSFLAGSGPTRSAGPICSPSAGRRAFAAPAAAMARPTSHRRRLIDECVACGKQHSLLAGTIFEQTKTGLARWFLAIYLVTSSKGGISAMELQRQMGFGSYQTAWALAAQDPQGDGRGRSRAAARPRGWRPTRPWSAAPGPASPAVVRPARRWSPARSRPAAARAAAAGSAGCGCRRCPTPRPRAWKASSPPTSPRPPRSPPTAGRAMPGSSQAGYAHEPINLAACWGDAVLRLPGDPPRLRPRQALAARHPPRRGQPEAPPGLSRRVRLPLQPPHRQEHQPPLRPPGRAGRPHPTRHLPRHRRPNRAA